MNWTRLMTELFLAWFLLCYALPKVETHIREDFSKTIRTRIEKEKPLERRNKGKGIIYSAERRIGTPYVFGGTSFKTGIDCSYFTQYVYNENGIKIPRTASQQYSEGIRIGKKHLLPGDLVFFATRWIGPSHVGIFIGDNMFIHASSSGVKISNLGTSYYRKRYIGARRIEA